MQHEHKGAGRQLVLLSGEPRRELLDALATKFNVHAFVIESVDVNALKAAFEQLHLERPLIVAHGRGAEAAVAIAPKRFPRGVVFIGEAREVAAPVLQLAESDVEKIAAFDQPLK